GPKEDEETHRDELNENLLKKEQDIIKIKAMTKEYFSINDNGETSSQIVWDAYKAVARGFLIQLNSSKRRVAGLKINKKKTMILTKNMSKRKQKELQEISGMETPAKIKYLGIWISAKNNQLLDLNYTRKWKEIKGDLEKWKNLNVSLLGRIAVIKMNILPKLLYLFQNIPIIRSTKLFKDWQKEIMRFIWRNKKARIKYSTMIAQKTQGGFGVPDLNLYHDACALCWLKDWVKLQKIKILNLEGHELRRGWHGYLWYGKTKIEKQFVRMFVRPSLAFHVVIVSLSY
uniref:Reverse transcriptase domain-containing protein n=1 Tax=Anolis carolinensis TaxID=28377 RepID=A0A803SVM4_ANOCA